MSDDYILRRLAYYLAGSRSAELLVIIAGDKGYVYCLEAIINANRGHQVFIIYPDRATSDETYALIDKYFLGSKSWLRLLEDADPSLPPQIEGDDGDNGGGGDGGEGDGGNGGGGDVGNRQRSLVLTRNFNNALSAAVPIPNKRSTSVHYGHKTLVEAALFTFLKNPPPAAMMVITRPVPKVAFLLSLLVDSGGCHTVFPFPFDSLWENSFLAVAGPLGEPVCVSSGPITTTAVGVLSKILEDVFSSGISICHGPYGHKTLVEAALLSFFKNPFPFDSPAFTDAKSLWENFLLAVADSGSLSEYKSSETGEPIWACLDYPSSSGPITITAVGALSKIPSGACCVGLRESTIADDELVLY